MSRPKRPARAASISFFGLMLCLLLGRILAPVGAGVFFGTTETDEPTDPDKQADYIGTDRARFLGAIVGRPYRASGVGAGYPGRCPGLA